MTLAGPFSFFFWRRIRRIEAELIKEVLRPLRSADHSRLHVDIRRCQFYRRAELHRALDNSSKFTEDVRRRCQRGILVVYVGRQPRRATPTPFKALRLRACLWRSDRKIRSDSSTHEELAPDKIELALTSDDVRRIKAKGKKAALIGVNGLSDRRGRSVG